MADRNRVVLLLFIAQLAVACGPKAVYPDGPPRNDARLITHEEIERTGAVDALEALNRSGSFLNVSDRKNQLRATQRGRSSFLLSPQILLVVDGIMMADLNALRTIRAENVDWMRIMTGMEATPVYGTQGSNGVLLVATRIPDTD